MKAGGRFGSRSLLKPLLPRETEARPDGGALLLDFISSLNCHAGTLLVGVCRASRSSDSPEFNDFLGFEVSDVADSDMAMNISWLKMRVSSYSFLSVVRNSVHMLENRAGISCFGSQIIFLSAMMVGVNSSLSSVLSLKKADKQFK